MVGHLEPLEVVAAFSGVTPGVELPETQPPEAGREAVLRQVWGGHHTTQIVRTVSWPKGQGPRGQKGTSGSSEEEQRAALCCAIFAGTPSSMDQSLLGRGLCPKLG